VSWQGCEISDLISYDFMYFPFVGILLFYFVCGLCVSRDLDYSCVILEVCIHSEFILLRNNVQAHV